MPSVTSLQNFGRALSYRASSLASAGSARSVYGSIRRGMISAADDMLLNRDPVFAFIDCESLGRDLDFDVALPVSALARSTTLLEKLCLGLLLQLKGPQVIFEFGTYRGATTRLLFRNAPETARLWSFDIPSDIDSQSGLDRTRLIDLAAAGLRDDFERDCFPVSDRATQIYADLNRVDWAHVRALPKPDFVFIDADHSYEGCLRDTRNVLDWVGDDAMIAWHDAAWKNFACMEAQYGVHASIAAATSEAARAYTFRVKDTSLIVRSKAHAALFDRHRHPALPANGPGAGGQA